MCRWWWRCGGEPTLKREQANIYAFIAAADAGDVVLLGKKNFLQRDADARPVKLKSVCENVRESGGTR